MGLAGLLKGERSGRLGRLSGKLLQGINARRKTSGRPSRQTAFRISTVTCAPACRVPKSANVERKTRAAIQLSEVEGN
jgi:hypothetical protein